MSSGRTFLANSLDAWTPTTTFWDFLAADLTETKLAVNDEVKADIFTLVFCVYLWSLRANFFRFYFASSRMAEEVRKKAIGSGMEDFGILIPCLLGCFFLFGARQKKTKNKQKVNNSKHKRTLREREKRAIDVEDLRCASNLKQTRGNETNAGFPSFGRQDQSDCKTIGWRK